MGLAPEQLDDLTWEQLRLAARDDMFAASRGRWTLHAPVDPGVTLTELYAWLIDQRSYWIDRIPAALQHALLALLKGAARRAQPARGVVAIAPPEKQKTPTPPAVIAEGTLLTAGRGKEQLTFRCRATTAWWPIDTIGLVAEGRDRTRDLERGLAVRLFAGPSPELRRCPHCPPPPAPPEPIFELSLASSFRPGTAAPVALLLDVDAPLVAPAWSAEARYVAPPAKLQWEAETSPEVWAPLSVIDGTRGLRRAGLLRFDVPDAWTSQVGPYRLRARVHEASWTSPPRLRRVVPNALVVEHAHWVALDPEKLAWLPVAGHDLVLDHEGDIIAAMLDLREEDGSWQRWKQIADLTFAGPGDRVFTVDRARGVVAFGDGRRGRVPRPSLDGSDNFRGRLLVGGGEKGNLATGLGMAIVGQDNLCAKTVTDLSGGAEQETPDAALRRHGAQHAARRRAVTVEDHAELARGERTESDDDVARSVAIARSHAELGFDPQRRCVRVLGLVTVFAVPGAPRAGLVWGEPPESFVDSAFVAAPTLDAAALDHLRARLDGARLAGSEVLVLPPRYREVFLRVAARGDIDDPESLRVAIDGALRRYLDPLVGGADKAGWPFGGPLRPSELVGVAQTAAPGVRIEQVSVALGDEPARSASSTCCAACRTRESADRNYESCRETPLASHELPVVAEMAIKLWRGPA